jgi:hypothetical protein
MHNAFYVKPLTTKIIIITLKMTLWGRRFSALRRAIAEVKRRWSVIRWVTKNILFRAPPCFGRHIKLLVPSAFAVVSTHQLALCPRGFRGCYGPFSLCVIHKVGLCPSSGNFNRLMMMIKPDRILLGKRFSWAAFGNYSPPLHSPDLATTWV